jgi:hypothetical protein
LLNYQRPVQHPLTGQPGTSTGPGVIVLATPTGIIERIDGAATSLRATQNLLPPGGFRAATSRRLRMRHVVPTMTSTQRLTKCCQSAYK